MTIEEFLKQDSNNARLTNDTKWLVWYLDEWVVFDRPYGKKNNRCCYSGENLDEVLRALA